MAAKSEKASAKAAGGKTGTVKSGSSKPGKSGAAKPAKPAKPASTETEADQSAPPGKKSKSSALKTTVVDTPPRKTHAEKKQAIKQPEGPVLRGLRSAIYQVPADRLDDAKRFYIALTGKAPYFDQPYYVGFDVYGTELGLDPDTSTRQPGPNGGVAYWRVDRVQATFDLAVAQGATEHEAPHDVGGGLQIAIVVDPFGNYVGLIEMP